MPTLVSNDEIIKESDKNSTTQLNGIEVFGVAEISDYNITS